MTNWEILEIAKRDRIKLISGKGRIGFIKNFSLDMAIKFLFLLINSFGQRKIADFIFVDEIKNNSMIDNLYLTKEQLKKENSFVLKFHALSPNDHVKIGIVTAMVLTILFFIQITVILPLVIFGRWFFTKVVLFLLYYNFIFYLNLLPVNRRCKVIAMTDHHYFSSIMILRLKGKLNSFVLQHGAIVYLDYYLPVYADYFLAWGEGSKEKLGNLDNVLVTGTYKFSKLNVPAYDTKEEGLKVLWPLRPLPDSILKQYFSTIVTALGKLEVPVEIIIKRHPSSMSNFKFLSDLSTPNNFRYQVVDKTLEQIGKIDFAIIDNSTIGYDLFVANIPFLMLKNLMKEESIIHYEKYGIQTIFIPEDLEKYIINFTKNPAGVKEEFTRSQLRFLKNELNHNICHIKEEIVKI